ncbi:DUF998 domain-containing protein [Croceitalea sp. P059]|uniref:DUF998 domain-containing protein n=1 Tax=Croceitalea sp. P059 TaxID=3075601 RepID=UPI0028846F14|nr:DUF998 domain-containing protein [Croceitalea sp. P059]MDT0538862.1 DUF998 domain-containing protein [Croceitalea sp. P059]
MNKIENFLNLDFSKKDQAWIHSSYKLRQTVGIAGMLMPILLMFSLYLYNEVDFVLPSISHYYFTRSGTIFTSVLIVLGTFLLIYKSYEKLDFWLSTLAGVFALFVALAPTSNLVEVCCAIDMKHAITHFSDDTKELNPRILFHYISAGLFFLCLAIMSFFLFTKTEKGKKKTKHKKIRNIIYKSCAVVMVLSILIILFNFNNEDPTSFYNRNHMTFWLEFAAVEAFGLSWLIKGETLFKDKKVNDMNSISN